MLAALRPRLDAGRRDRRRLARPAGAAARARSPARRANAHAEVRADRAPRHRARAAATARRASSATCCCAPPAATPSCCRRSAAARRAMSTASRRRAAPARPARGRHVARRTGRAGAAAPWRAPRLRELLGAYLPLLLMALLALGTWWLVQNTPRPARRRRPARAAPRARLLDARLRGAALRARRPRCACSIEGAWLRHYPDTDTHRDRQRARPRHRTPDGRVTQAQRARARWPTATAPRCSCSAARSVVRAERSAAARCAIEFAASSCTPSCNTERVRSHLPVRLRQGDDEFRADGIEYDNLAQRVAAAGPRARQLLAAGRRASAAPRGQRHERAAAGLHHRRVQRHRPGAGGALPRARAGGWRWWRGAPPRCEPGRARRASTHRRCRSTRADVRDIDSIIAAGRACIAAPGPAATW